MPTITHVKDSKLNLDYGYMFDIQSQEELTDYWHKCRAVQMRDGVRDVLKCLDGRGHITTSYGSIVNMHMQCGKGLLEAVALTETTLLTTMQRILRESGRLLVNTNGGYFSPHENIEEVDTQEVDKYILPGASIVISQWPGGKHWYARVGNEDVEMWGKRKWDTRKEAMRVAVRFQQEKKDTMTQLRARQETGRRE